MTKKIKIMTMGDHPLSFSGVGLQTRMFIESMLKTGKYTFISLAAGRNHPKKDWLQTEEYGDDWRILPVDDFGTHDIVRGILKSEKPDILWLMTDPRYWEWLWTIEAEVRSVIPIIYYHVWDNYPYPSFNKKFYDSNDAIATISKVSDDIVKTLSPKVKRIYIPHVVDGDIYRKLPEEHVEKFLDDNFASIKGKKLFFWNNRNIRRKHPGRLIYWFKEFLDEIGEDKACLIMHTDPNDQFGANLNAIINELELNENGNLQVMVSSQKYDAAVLAMLYNIADCTVNIADAEGFGLGTLESLSCETPIIVSMTGGLQEQVTDGKDWFGVGLEPAVKAVISSQQVPFIHEDKVSKEDFIAALKKIYNMSKKELEALGKKGREHVNKNYNTIDYINKWDKLLTQVHKNGGSWGNRKGFKTWSVTKVL